MKEDDLVDEDEDSDVVLLARKVNALVKNITQNRFQGRGRNQGVQDYARKGSSVVLKENFYPLQPEQLHHRDRMFRIHFSIGQRTTRRFNVTSVVGMGTLQMNVPTLS